MDGVQYKKKLAVREVVTNLCHLASGLALLHCKGVVHHDLHTGNVLVAKDGKSWVLSDFGNSYYRRHANGDDNELHSMM